jgi:hypothetical protein
VQALLPPDAPSPPDAEAAGRGLEQPTIEAMKTAMITRGIGVWVLGDLVPDIDPSQLTKF